MADETRTERSRYGRILDMRQDRLFDQSGINFPPLGARRRTWQRRSGITTARCIHPQKPVCLSHCIISSESRFRSTSNVKV